MHRAICFDKHSHFLSIYRLTEETLSFCVIPTEGCFPSFVGSSVSIDLTVVFNYAMSIQVIKLTAAVAVAIAEPILSYIQIIEVEVHTVNCCQRILDPAYRCNITSRNCANNVYTCILRLFTFPSLCGYLPLVTLCIDNPSQHLSFHRGLGRWL